MHLLTTVIGLLVLGSSSQAFAQSAKELYELQERCGRRAEETFKKEWGANIVNSRDIQMVANYENHYSTRLNKCFYLEISTSHDQAKHTSVKSLRLFDLNDNKEYATFIEGLPGLVLLMCDVRGKQCQSETEWRELIKPLMED
jgi:hypothetical protein